MDKTNITVMEGNNILISYEKFAANIATVLELRYRLPAEEAEEAVRFAELRPVFELDPEMVLHTSYEGWAEDVLAYWNECQS